MRSVPSVPRTEAVLGDVMVGLQEHSIEAVSHDTFRRNPQEIHRSFHICVPFHSFLFSVSTCTSESRLPVLLSVGTGRSWHESQIAENEAIERGTPRRPRGFQGAWTT